MIKVKDIIGNGSTWIPNRCYGEIIPEVTVIIPTYSDERVEFLKNCVDSVLGQSFQNLELIIVEDGKTDLLTATVEKYMERDKRVNAIIHEENLEFPSVSIYEAYSVSRGSYFLFLFDDMIIDAGSLEKTVRLMKEKNLKSSYGITKICNMDDEVVAKLGEDSKSVPSLWAGNTIGLGSVVLHKDVIETVGLFDPHITMTLMIDWDLWTRITEKFNFFSTGIQFSTEYKNESTTTMQDSLLYDQWIARERQQHRDTKMLLPEFYPENDIVECDVKDSDYFRNGIIKRYLQYQGKCWYDLSEISRLSDMETNSRHKFILVFCYDVTASIMNFTWYQGMDYTFLYVLIGNVSHSVLSIADIAVLIRMPEMEPVNSLCSLLSIPCYYFVDDNFIELNKENENDVWAKRISSKTTKKYLSQFKGIIVSTDKLKDYFLQNNLHSNVSVLSAVWHKPLEITKHKVFTVGFMGGPFRERQFIKTVLPALYSISEKMPIRLIFPCSEDGVDSVLSYGKKGLEIVPFVRTSNYEYLLNSYAGIGIDVLIHCGGNDINSKYKTKNALTNAVSLRSPLIASNMLPYSDFSDGSEGLYLLSENDEGSWKSALEKIIYDESFRKSLVDKELAFVEKNYNYELIWKELHGEFNRTMKSQSFDYIRRYEKLCNWILDRKFRSAKSLYDVYFFNRKKFIPEELAYSGEIKRKRRYVFSVDGESVREIGLLFVKSGICRGLVRLDFYKSNEKKPVQSFDLDMDKIVENDYTDVMFDDPIDIRGCKMMSMNITMLYEEKNGFIGLFEVGSRRSFIYKVFNKLGIPIPRKDVLFIDCRS